HPMADALHRTIGESLRLDRALMLSANDDGTTFAMPPLDIAGKYEVGSHLINIGGNRTLPHGAASVGWDEEGVPASSFPLVKEGVVVDYLTTRDTAPALAPYYKSRSIPLASRGCAADTGFLPVKLQMPNLSIEPGAQAVTREDLISDVSKG